MKPRFSDIRDRLRFVKTAREDYDLTKFPDFLISGPQRTGTTWLHECLMEHPEVYMPPGKELHYFSNLEYPEYHPKHLPPVYAELGWYLEHFEITKHEADRREAQCREAFGRGFTPKVLGEATATYAGALHERLIEEILLFNPDIKIIVMVRHPIERAWSHAKKGLTRTRPVADVPDEEWFKFLTQEYQITCGRYSTFLPKWRKLLPPQNLFLGRFIDVAGNPTKLLTDVYRFLGVDADEKLVPARARAQVDSTGAPRIPAQLMPKLEELFGDEVVRLRAEGLI